MTKEGQYILNKLSEKITILFLLISSFTFAQEIPQDTSYTVYSTYKKLVKKYPDIKIVEPELPENVKGDEEVVYSTIGKRNLKINVYFPSEKIEGGYPAVLFIHGGGWRSGDKSLQIPMAQKLAAHGYVTAVVEYRMSLEAKFPAAVHDLKAAIRWLRAHADKFNINSDKIAVYGASAGGQLAALVGTTNNNANLEGTCDYLSFSSSVQAIVDVDGVLAFKHPESKESTMAAEWLGGTSSEAPENWAEASALTHVDHNTPPTLFIASSHPRFHAGKSDMIKILEHNNIYYESYLIEDSPHAFWLMDPWFEPTFRYTLLFLNKVFKKGEIK